jgi:DNA-binding transcriptional ArsR family regulator
MKLYDHMVIQSTMPEHRHDHPAFLPADAAGVTPRGDAGDMMPAPVTRRSSTLSAAAIDMIAGRFRILGEPLRIRIIQELEGGEKTVTQLVDAVGSTQPNVSKHLRLMQEAGIVGRRQEGTSVYCFVSDPSVLRLCDAVCSSLGERLTRDAKVGAELSRGIRGKR